MATRVMVLVENTAGAMFRVRAEHGLAFFVEHDGHAFLFDTGQRGTVVENARVLGVDLGRIEAILLSHGHYDHTGGLRAVLEELGRGISVYGHPDVFSSHYVRDSRREPLLRYIGIPFRKEELASLGAEFRLGREAVEVFPGVWWSGEVPRRTEFEEGDPRMVVLEEGGEREDPILDDASVYLVTPEGLVILLGCAHAGVINIVEHARSVTGVSRVRAILGGTHLGSVPESQVRATLEALEGLDFDLLAANHCTGLEIEAELRHRFGSRFAFAPAGAVFTF